jgi:GNAT superfamily N-acetyltransferase
VSDVRIRRAETLDPRTIDGLCEVLIDCVDGGASVSFMAPMTRAKAERFWARVAESVARGERTVLVAEDEAGIVGTVQLVVDLPENQPHRADVAKMLVHRRARRRGIGARLLAAVETTAASFGRSLLVLDTVTGSEAWRMYARHGWQRCGDIPGYALWPDGRPCDTTVYYKAIRLGVADAPPVPAGPRPRPARAARQA